MLGEDTARRSYRSAADDNIDWKFRLGKIAGREISVRSTSLIGGNRIPIEPVGADVVGKGEGGGSSPYRPIYHAFTQKMTHECGHDEPR